MGTMLIEVAIYIQVSILPNIAGKRLSAQQDRILAGSMVRETDIRSKWFKGIPKWGKGG